MLETIAAKLGRFVVGFIVVLVGGVMILQFGGPQAEGCTSGGASVALAAAIYDEKITIGEFQANQRLLGFDRQPEDVRKAERLDEFVLRGLVDRTLLAREAARLGLHVSEEDALRRMIEKSALLVSVDVDAPPSVGGGEIPLKLKDESGKLDDEYLKNLIQFHLRRSVSEFANAQASEILAERMRDVVRASVRVAPSEVWFAYVAETEKAELETMRFSPKHYGKNLTLSPAELDAWMAANAEELDEQYEAQKSRYTGLDKQVRARQVLVTWATEDEAGKAAAKQEADAARAKAAAGADFAKLASAVSDDEDSKEKGGDLGFTARGQRPEPFDSTVFTLAPGQVSDVVEGPGGYYFWKAEAVREGDVPVEEAKREIAEGLARDAKAVTLAKAAADKAVAALAAGKSFAAYDRELAGLKPLKEGESAPEDEEDPRAGDFTAPKLEATGTFGRGEPPFGAEGAAELIKLAFETLTPEAPVATAPVSVGGDFVVVRLKSRELAKEEGFTKDAQGRIAERLRSEKREEAVRLFVHALRARAQKDGELTMDLALVSTPPSAS